LLLDYLYMWYGITRANPTVLREPSNLTDFTNPDWAMHAKKKSTFMALFRSLIIINPKRILVRLRLSVWQLALSLKIPLSQPKTPSLHLHARTRRNATWVCTSSHEATNSPQRHNAAHLGLLSATRCCT